MPSNKVHIPVVLTVRRKPSPVVVAVQSKPPKAPQYLMVFGGSCIVLATILLAVVAIHGCSPYKTEFVSSYGSPAPPTSFPSPSMAIGLAATAVPTTALALLPTQVPTLVPSPIPAPTLTPVPPTPIPPPPPTPIPVLPPAPTRLVVDILKADGTPYGVCMGIYRQTIDAAGRPALGEWVGSSGYVCNQSHASFDVSPGVYALELVQGGGFSPAWGYYPQQYIYNHQVVQGQTTNVRIALGRLRVALLAANRSALTGASVWVKTQSSDVNGNPVYGDPIIESYTGDTGYAEFDLTEGTYSLEVGKGCCGVGLNGQQFNHVVRSGEITEERIYTAG